jgi:hypothetical protein
MLGAILPIAQRAVSRRMAKTALIWIKDIV